MPLTFHTNSNSKQINTAYSFIIESFILLLSLWKNCITYYALSVSLSCHQNFVIRTLPELFHDWFTIVGATIFKSFFINKHQRWEDFWLLFLSFLDELNNNIFTCLAVKLGIKTRHVLTAIINLSIIWWILFWWFLRALIIFLKFIFNIW